MYVSCIFLLQEKPNENPATSSLETLIDALLQVPIES